MDFINNKNKSLDEIFNEINQLYGIKSNEDIFLIELNDIFKEIDTLINEDDDNEYINIIDNILSETNENDNEDSNDAIKKQLIINQNLQNEINTSANMFKNPETISKIANNPNIFMQSGKTSMGLLPDSVKNENQYLVNNNGNQAASNFSLGGIVGNIVSKSTMIGSFYIGATKGYTYNTAGSGLMSMGIDKIIHYSNKLINLLNPKNLFSSSAKLANDRAFALGSVNVDVSPKNIGIILKNALTKNSNGEFVNPSLLKQISSITDKNAQELSSIIGDKKAIIELLKDKFYKSGFLYRNGSLEITKSVDALGNSTVHHMISFPSVDGISPISKSYCEGNVSILNVNKWRYVAVAIGLAILFIWLYKKVKKRQMKIKKEEYSQMNDISVNEITIPMLCEYFSSEADYIQTMQLIDEGFLDFIIGGIKKVFNLPYKLLKLIDKGIESMQGLAASVENGLKTKTMNSIMAKIYNGLIAIGKVVLYIARAFVWVIATPLKKLAGNDDKDNKNNEKNNNINKEKKEK